MTGIANAHIARAQVLILSGGPPRPQENRGGLQDLPHVEMVRPITRYARTVREPSLVLQELDDAVARAAGEGGEPGPVYLDFPTDTLRGIVPKPMQLEEHFRPRARAMPTPDSSQIEAAVDALWSARRPLIISGRGARGAGAELRQFLDALGAPYLDTGESKGLVPDDHPSVVAAMRGAIMGEADVVVTLGRRLDFQLAYGSPAVFGSARFVRIGDIGSELRDNRRGDVEVFAAPGAALAAMLRTAGSRQPQVDRAWVDGMRQKHRERAQKLRTSMAAAPSDAAGRIHPNRVLSELQKQLDPDAVIVADGGDFLSFARVGLSSSTYLDPGSLGCIGVGTPFGIAASLAFPGRQVVVATGDGAFGFNAMEIDTAVRHKAEVLVIVANNGAWQIEVHDQTDTHGKVVGTRLQFADHAAMARAFGMHAERVESADQLEGAIRRAMANRPALLDVVVSPEARSSDGKSGLAWVPDLQPLGVWDDAERQWREGN
jgi:acetolactate synthase-1/2/3 large subunit